jgi:flagellar motor switch protein FliM
LSQEEIDALLGGLSGGKIDTKGTVAVGAATERRIVPFDFTDQDQFVRTRLPTLETIHDRMVRLMRLNLSTTLRRGVEIQVSSQNMCSFGDFSRSLEKPSSLHLLKLDPLKGHGLLVLPGRLILTLVDLLFGGDGAKPLALGEDRDFTLIERRVIAKIVEEFCECYADAWKAVYPVEIQCTGSETNVQFINIAQPSESVTVMDCDVLIEGNHSALALCLPYVTLEPIMDILRGSYVNEDASSDDNWTTRLRENLLGSGVELRALLGTATINLQELLQLKIGDIVQLNEDYEHPIEISVEGERKFWGAVGSHKSNRALQITGIEPQKGNG